MADRMMGLSRRVGAIALACVKSNAAIPGWGAASICTQHCIPQLAAQGHPLSWPAGADERSTEAAAAHRLDVNGLPAATESGNSTACKVIT